jgi:hypothetical protein
MIFNHLIPILFITYSLLSKEIIISSISSKPFKIIYGIIGVVIIFVFIAVASSIGSRNQAEPLIDDNTVPSIIVTDTVGLNVTDAQNAITGQGLTSTLIASEGNDIALLDPSTWTVVSQSPVGGTPAEGQEVVITLTVTAPPVLTEPAPVVEPAPAPAPVVEAPAPAPAPVVSYANCDEVKAAGVAPITRDQPGYASKLDRDGDGIACDK